ncbi:MAG: hypothetical protein P8Y70_21135 [Candidatus Lokiarchaeota archaeon]
MKRTSARTVEALNSLMNIIDREDVENFNIRYTEHILFFRKISNEVAIIALVEYGKDIERIKEWISENHSKIASLFQ